MSNIIGNVKKFSRKVIPVSVRNSNIISGIRKSKTVSGFTTFLYGHLDHDTIYNADYFERKVRDVQSAEVITASITEDLQPQSLVDVGCGTGELLAAMHSSCTTLGLELAEAALRYCRKRALNVKKFDLERDDFLDKDVFDVVISMEVAEHLPKKAAERYVDLLAQLCAGYIVFTAAPPGQGGTDHVNEQPAIYWIQKFMARGFKLDSRLSESWRKRWKASQKVLPWYNQNIMVFRRVDFD